MKSTARHLILELLLAAKGMSLSAREAIAACEVFGVSQNNVRVALVRLSSEGMVESTERGIYRLSHTAHELADEVVTWRHAEQRLRAWHGGYLVVHSGPLGRRDRTALRRRNRALDMLGFRELDPGFYVRPDNIEDDIQAVRTRLHSLGLEPEASVFVASQFDPSREARLRTLWDLKSLNSTYRKLRAQLEDWMARADALELDVAARESFLLGRQAIRHVLFDPLLPEPMVDTGARRDFIEAVHRYDRVGQGIWQQLLAAARGESALPPALAPSFEQPVFAS